MSTLKRKNQSRENDFLDDVNDGEGRVDERGSGAETIINSENGTGTGGSEGVIELKKKEVKKRLKVDTSRLRGVDGLRRVYEEFPVICEFKGRGSEAKYLSNLIERYKEWSWQLYPSFEYTEVLSRTYALSKDAAMRSLVEQLRKEECARRMKSKYGVEIPQDAYVDDNDLDNLASATGDEPKPPSAIAVSPKKTNNNNNNNSNGAAPLSDDMYVQAMMMYEQTSKSNVDTSTDAGAIALSDSDDDDEEEEFEIEISGESTNVSSKTPPKDSDKSNDDAKVTAVRDDEADGDINGEDVMANLLAMDSVMDDEGA